MKFSDHVRHTEQLYGVRAEDIHSWIDGLFDMERFDQYQRSGDREGYNPYAHREFRHCREALEDAFLEFRGAYSQEIIQKVFECHVKDDYQGYLPSREDFTYGTFTEKYHEDEELAAQERILSKAELTEYFKDRQYTRKSARRLHASSGFYLRIVLPTVCALVLFILTLFILEIPVFHDAMIERKKEMIKELTTVAVGAVDYYIAQEQKGLLSREEAQQAAAAEIGRIRYGADMKDYFWITDMFPRMIMHPFRSELIGQDLRDYRDRDDVSGKLLFVECAELVRRKGAGYLTYRFQWKDDPDTTVDKLSYVKGVDAWQWVVGTGIYIHDVEEETALLTRSTLYVSGTISLVLFCILLSIILYSRRMERVRQRAEAGLHEAKDRYRALVESSHEGYLLYVDGEIVYSNQALFEMLGYTEDALSALQPWQLLNDDVPGNGPASSHLRRMARHEAGAARYVVVARESGGRDVDVEIAIAKIFFSEKNGYVVSLRKIVHAKGSAAAVGAQIAVGPVLAGTTPSSEDAAESLSGPDAALLDEIRNAESGGQIIAALNRLPPQIRQYVRQGALPGTLRNITGQFFDATLRRLVTLAFDRIGPPPAPFCMLSLGSNARHEMTLFSDQDTALIFADTDDERVKNYFLRLGQHVCAALNKAGYPYCAGGIMAANPQWNMPISDWKKQISHWIHTVSNESMIALHVFVDNACVYGDEKLAGEFQECVLDTVAHAPRFLGLLAHDALLYKVPLDIMGRIRPDKKDGIPAIPIKECLKPLEIFSRVYVLKNSITETSTLSRLRRLLQLGVVEDRACQDAAYVFNYLWQLRFYNQLVLHDDLQVVDDMLELSCLAQVERRNLKNVLALIPDLQSQLNYDFLGGQGG